jgi:hypothetical protein
VIKADPRVVVKPNIGMLRLKQKKEQEKKAEEERAASDHPADTNSGDVSTGGEGVDSEPPSSGGGGLKLLGIGGKEARSASTNGKAATRKRTPGEIRIQKGSLSDLVFDLPFHPKSLSPKLYTPLVTLWPLLL